MIDKASLLKHGFDLKLLKHDGLERLAPSLGSYLVAKGDADPLIFALGRLHEERHVADGTLLADLGLG